MALRTGSMVGKRFRVEQRIARGGMAEVYAATDPSTGQAVVIKVPRSSRPDAIALLEREARMLSRIASPYVAAYLGSAPDDHGRPCIICERLEGETLAARLHRVRVLTLADLAPIVQHVLLGLADAHASGVLHRDLTGDNVFLARTASGEIAKLIDFGVGKPIDDSGGGGALTSRNATLGSLAYMAPEQWLDPSTVDARADFYSLGIIVFECLTGCLPFQEKTAVRLIALKGSFAAPSLSEATQVPYPPAASAFVAKALERQRERRFSSAGEMLAEWRAVLAGGGPMPVIAAPEAEGDSTATMTRAPRPRR